MQRSEKGLRNTVALLSYSGASIPERPGRREGSEEGCTSQEHPKPPSRAAVGSRLSTPSAKEFAGFAGPQGVVDAAQMAQAACALQQSVQQAGLGPYFMQQAYAPQVAQAQLQQVGNARPDCLFRSACHCMRAAKALRPSLKRHDYLNCSGTGAVGGCVPAL